jgi:hypothetical protein
LLRLLDMRLVITALLALAPSAHAAGVAPALALHAGAPVAVRSELLAAAVDALARAGAGLGECRAIAEAPPPGILISVAALPVVERDGARFVLLPRRAISAWLAGGRARAAAATADPRCRTAAARAALSSLDRALARLDEIVQAAAPSRDPVLAPRTLSPEELTGEADRSLESVTVQP